MITQCDINTQLTKAKICSADIAEDYVNSLRYGYVEKAKELFNKLIFLESYIRIFNDYELSEGVFAENSFLHRFGKKALLSEDNSLHLESENQKILLSEEELNCLTKDELCGLAEKVSSICSTC